MTPQDAVEYVKLNADASTQPAVSDAEVKQIVDANAVVDSEGNSPSAPGWNPTYLLARAVYQVLDLKVMRCSTWTDISTDGTSLPQSQVPAMLRKQAATWRRRTAMGVQ